MGESSESPGWAQGDSGHSEPRAAQGGIGAVTSQVTLFPLISGAGIIQSCTLATLWFPRAFSLLRSQG